MKTRRNLWRTVFQWGVIAAIGGFIAHAAATGGRVDVEAYCPFGGLEAAATYMHQHSLPCSMTVLQIVIGLTLAVGVVLFSRLFCSYLCPVGTVSEYLGRLGRKMHVHVTVSQHNFLDKVLRLAKYALLFWIMYMTVTSSELFCKRFDPYYAVATGFQGEIIMWLSIVIVAIVVIGSMVLDMFWCRYLCPLGALSNIFKFTPMFIIALAAAFVLEWLGYGQWWWVVLAVACAAAYLLEVVKRRSCYFPLMYVERDAAKCTSCGLCEKACPNGIDVCSYEKLRHVDCTLCGRCVDACHTGSLQISLARCSCKKSGRKVARWIPAVIVVVLIALAMGLGSRTEIATVDLKWGAYQQVTNMQTLRLSGLGTVKCYGSSKVFATKMQSIEGVYGVRTFVKSHTAEILYDPSQTTARKIEESIFTPMVHQFAAPTADVTLLNAYHLGIDGLHDKVNVKNLFKMLGTLEGLYGVDVRFNCPVDVTLYTAPSVQLTEEQMRALIEVAEFTPKAAPGKTPKPIAVNFALKAFSPLPAVARDAFQKVMFEAVVAQSSNMKESFAKYGTDAHCEKACYELPYPQLEELAVQQNLGLLKSYLSTCDGITRVDFTRDAAGQPVIRLTYVAAMYAPAELWSEVLQAPAWKLRRRDGSFETVQPQLKFTVEGHAYNESTNQ